ncbi:winged helix-turn-helix domain-containing protein [Catellatospora sp. NPDC049609]|uniref:winged helix-turn-helix domain-containing protein n=1 Tax=Catellatospora sp. NPDC049609 TaxID=3155505 RepID=UPI0034364293
MTEPVPRLRRIAGLGELRAVSDGVRLAVLSILFDHPQRSFSVRELAERTGIAPTLMHYHLSILDSEQLVEVVVERGTRGRRERRYQALYEALRWDFPSGEQQAAP